MIWVVWSTRLITRATSSVRRMFSGIRMDRLRGHGRVHGLFEWVVQMLFIASCSRFVVGLDDGRALYGELV